MLTCIHSKPCKNNACCKDDKMGGYNCTCEPGFTGKNCEIGKIIQNLILKDQSLSLIKYIYKLTLK